jgi:GT2 family glycosyltransferase
VLLLSCAPRADGGGDGGTPGKATRGPVAIEARAFEAPQGRIVAAPLTGRLEGDRQLEFVDASGGKALLVEGGDLARALTDLRTFLREGPAGWSAATRTDLLGFLASLGAEYGLSASLSDGLHQAREALRERQPATIDDRRAGRGVAIERLHRIDERSFYIRGRAWDDAAPVAALAVTSPEGERVDLFERVFHAGGDSSFAGLFQLAAPTRGGDRWVVEAASELGHGVESSASLAPDALATLFDDAALDGAEELRERHILPAVARLTELRRASATIVDVAVHGRPPSAPAISLVVALQRRVDLLEHQLAQFAADREIAECELLYVLDDPEQSDDLRELAAELFGLYGVPFRVATLGESGGLPIACNLGASLAVADRLVFAGADVLPDRPGWLSAMATALDEHPRVGAATAKLLHADQGIDQAGLEYAQGGTGGDYAIRHRLRGMHRNASDAMAAGPVAAAALACLMIDATLFREVGGFRSEYGLGDYEGSDLSRRLAAAGRGLLYVPEAELYRLEGLGATPEALGEPYARWLHSRLWDPAIAMAGR